MSDEWRLTIAACVRMMVLAFILYFVVLYISNGEIDPLGRFVNWMSPPVAEQVDD